MVATNNDRPAFSLYRRVIIWLFGYDYFISYSHGDSDAYVHDLHRQLSQTHLGFVDSSGEGLFVGSPLAHEVTKALRRTKVLIVVYTESVATKSWTKLECRYFKTCHPDRPFIPVSASKDAEALRSQMEVLFDSNKDELSKILRVWLEKRGNSSGTPTSDDLDPCWAIESDRDHLGNSLPSERVVKQIQHAFYGISVPRKGAFAISTLMLITCLALSLGWSQFASSRGNAILADLSGRMGKEQIRELKADSDANIFLMAELHESALSSSARVRGVELETEFSDVMQKIRAYDFYRRWNFLSRGYEGVAIALYSIPDVVPAPMSTFPARPVEVRLICTELNENWLLELQKLDSCDLLAITCEEIASEEVLLDILDSLHVHDLRFRKCRRIDLDTLSRFSNGACSSLKALSLSLLDDLVVESDQDELRLVQFLKRCKNLTIFRMREIPHCTLTGVFSKAIATHPSLCQKGGELHFERQMLSQNFSIKGNGEVKISGGFQDIEQSQ